MNDKFTDLTSNYEHHRAAVFQRFSLSTHCQQLQKESRLEPFENLVTIQIHNVPSSSVQMEHATISHLHSLEVKPGIAILPL
jgi:hypothetical protein